MQGQKRKKLIVEISVSSKMVVIVYEFINKEQKGNRESINIYV